MYRRRLLLLLLGTSTAACLSFRVANAQPEHDKAEEFFRQMEKQCVEAKKIEVAFEGKFEGGFSGKLTGCWTIAVGNRFCLETEGKLAVGPNGQQPIKLLMVSDGKKSTTASLDPQVPAQVVDASQTLDAEGPLMFARAGVLGPMFFLAENVPPGKRPREFDANQQLRVSDFRTGDDGRQPSQNACVIHHKLHNRNYRNPLEVTVWLDAATMLPTKRVTRVAEEGRTMTLTESYASLTLDGKVPEERFQLPRK